jgi:hypothetical protein
MLSIGCNAVQSRLGAFDKANRLGPIAQLRGPFGATRMGVAPLHAASLFEQAIPVFSSHRAAEQVARV